MTPVELMQRTFDLARAGLGTKGHRPFASIIARDGSIICEAVSHSGLGNDPTAHAEILAVREACEKLKTRDLGDCDLYTTCEPCPLCFTAMWLTRIRKTYYAAISDDCDRVGIPMRNLIDELRLPMAERSHPSERLMVGDGISLFDDWFKSQNTDATQS